MAFLHGKAALALVGANDLSSYLNQIDAAMGASTHETTTFNPTGDGRTYIAGQRDGTASLGGLFDGAADAVDEELQAILGGSGQVVTFALDRTDGSRARLLTARETSYQVTSPVSDVVSVSAEMQADGGVYGGVILAPLTARTATANGNSVNNTAATSGGGVGHLHVTTRSGTSPTLAVKIQHSTNNSTWVDLITFTTATAATSQSSSVTGTVNQYVRAIWTTGGTSPNFTFAVAFARK